MVKMSGGKRGAGASAAGFIVPLVPFPDGSSVPLIPGDDELMLNKCRRRRAGSWSLPPAAFSSRSRFVRSKFSNQI